jgi:hypothetical protein
MIYSLFTGDDMLQAFKRINGPSQSSAVKTAISLIMLTAIAGCGGGSNDGTTTGTQLSAASKAVPDNKAKPGLPDAASDVARRATAYDPIVNSTNPAMRKLARMQCIKRAKISPGVDKVDYPASSIRDLRQDNCAVIMAVDAK